MEMRSDQSVNLTACSWKYLACSALSVEQACKAVCICADTGELADMSLEYLSGDSLALRPESLPSAGRWPQPALDHRWPFNGGLVDYVRPVGPGVYVGVGWKLGKGARGKQFLYFIMAHVQASA